MAVDPAAYAHAAALEAEIMVVAEVLREQYLKGEPIAHLVVAAQTDWLEDPSVAMQRAFLEAAAKLVGENHGVAIGGQTFYSFNTDSSRYMIKELSWVS